MNAVCDDIVRILNDSGFGVAGTDLFSYEFNEEIDDQTVVIDTGGRDIASQKTENPTFKILRRGKPNESARFVSEKARAIYQFLNNAGSVNVGNGCYSGFYPDSGQPTLIGRDDNDRAVYTINFNTFRTLR